MELKEYQQKVLTQIKQYLERLDEWRTKAEANPDLEIDFPLKAWEKALVGRPYVSRKNGLGEPLPNFCLKIPTGGGKTFLAVKAIDLINTIYRKKRTGLILWVMPTNQIYRQTIQNLRNREHPYRQHLDIASGGRTMIVQKTDRFTPLDVAENLVVLMLMLPSAARQSKETLKVFRDSGGFADFFPAEDDREGQKKILEQYPNLDIFGDANGFWGRQVKTSLGNTLRLLSPVIILDEGHKAYSQTAQETLRGFNPSLVLELSATPSRQSNILVDIRGVELNREEMIKLELHIVNKASPDWKDILLASVEKRNFLEEKAKEYEANTNIHIRPICLIQVERTGRDQRSGRYIHSEDVREYLTRTAGIPGEQVAVTSAELKEIEGIDLLAKDCPIRYIITKQALQEGWDCAFAYILAVLTNPTSKNAMTQLVGRILRQPYARKTKINPLDESYVFTFQQRATNILANVKQGFEYEGLGDLVGHIAPEEGFEEETRQERVYEIREKFKKAAERVVLPVFAINDRGRWRKVDYEMDIVSRIPWGKADVSPLYSLVLSDKEERGVEVAVDLSEDPRELIRGRLVELIREGGLKLDFVFLTRHLLDMVPNPWIAYELGTKAILKLAERYNESILARNLVFIIEELRKHLLQEKDRLARLEFLKLLENGTMRLVVIGKDLGFRFRKKTVQKSTSRTLTRADAQPLQRSLFEFMPEEDFNETEKTVAWYLEEQDKLFFWYRNIARWDYAIQGWRKHRIYPDFIFSGVDPGDGTKYDKVFVVETKGLHLKNEDTQYKQNVFELCNELAEEKSWLELGQDFPNKKVLFQVVFEDEWKRKINQLLSS